MIFAGRDHADGPVLKISCFACMPEGRRYSLVT
jgi:hypothetical protein